MISIINSFDLSSSDWLIFICCGLLIGMAKTGLSGAGLMIVPMMASVFGGRASVGIVLPMLIIADIFAVKYYNRHANWKHVIRLIPWAFIGILAGWFFGNKVDDLQFKQAIAILVILGIALMLWQERRKNKIKVPDAWWFAAVLGVAGGFTSMVGNAAGPIFTLYLLSMLLPKNDFIGTGAWFYFILNIMKLPFHVFSWKTINVDSLVLELFILPAIFIGAFLGVRIVRLIPEKAYRIFIIVSTIIAAIFLF